MTNLNERHMCDHRPKPIDLNDVCQTHPQASCCTLLQYSCPQETVNWSKESTHNTTSRCLYASRPLALDRQYTNLVGAPPHAFDITHVLSKSRTALMQEKDCANAWERFSTLSTTLEIGLKKSPVRVQPRTVCDHMWPYNVIHWEVGHTKKWVSPLDLSSVPCQNNASSTHPLTRALWWISPPNPSRMKYVQKYIRKINVYSTKYIYLRKRNKA